MNPNERTGRMMWLAALAALLFWSRPVSAGELPFKGSIDGSFVANPTADPAIFLSEAHAVGLATHIGAFSKVTQDVTNIANGAVNGAFTMTAANGDHLTGVYSGLFTFGPTPGALSWILNATLTGGTGRFSTATGKFVFIAKGQAVIVGGVVHGEYTETFEGTISY